VSHPALQLDDVVHQRTRLGILGVLVEATRVDFAFIKDALSLTDGNLSRHLQVLEEAGLVNISKVFEGKRPRTWLSVTGKGRAAFEDEVAALREIVARADGRRKRPGQ
jgi:DNA-binding MarR family transcriptional regulator